MYIQYSEDRLFKELGRTRQLFFDWDLVASVFQITRTFHHPQKHLQNPLLVRNRPWEVIPYFRGNAFNVIRDPGGQGFQCWYEDYFHFFGGEFRRRGNFNRLYYAHSADGLQWEKPTFKKHLIDDHPTNTVFSYPPYKGGSASDSTVIFDPKAKDPRHRYKMIYYDRLSYLKQERTGYPGGGLCLATSPDGIDWEPWPTNPIVPDWGSDMQQVYFDPVDDQFVCYGRARARASAGYHPIYWESPVWPEKPSGIWGTRRRIFRITSEDCIHWGEPVLAFDPDDRDNIDDQHYGFMYHRLTADWRIGLLTVFHYVDNTVDNVMLFSRDGEIWDRRFARQPFIPRGAEGSYDQYDAETSSAPLEVGDELWWYYGGGRVHHDYWIHGDDEGLDIPEAKDPELARSGYGLCLATMRKDGFVSLDAGLREGWIETKPIFSRFPMLYVNAKCHDGGYLSVQVESRWNRPFSGFSSAKSIPFKGDSVLHPMEWKGVKDLGTLDTAFKLRFTLRNAELYSFHFGEGQ